MSLKNVLLPDNVVDAACGDLHSLAVTSGGELYSWGNNGFGQTGHGDNTHRSSPTRVGSRSDWVRVFAGSNHSIAQTSDGKFYGFGLNILGQLGDNLTMLSHQVRTPQVLFQDSDNLTASQIATAQQIRGDINTLSTNVYAGPNYTIFVSPDTVFLNNYYASASYRRNNVFLLGANPSFMANVVQYDFPTGIGAIPTGTTDYDINDKGILLNRYNMLAMNGMVRLWSDVSWSGYNGHNSTTTVKNLGYNARLDYRTAYPFIGYNNYTTRSLANGGEAFYVNLASFMVSRTTRSSDTLNISNKLMTHEKSSDYTYSAVDASVHLDDHTVFAVSANNDLLASVAPRRFISWNGTNFAQVVNNYITQPHHYGTPSSNILSSYRVSVADDTSTGNPYYANNNRPESSPLFNSYGGGMDGTGDLQLYGSLKAQKVFNGRDRIYVLDTNHVLHSAGKDDNYLLGRDVSTSTPANELHPASIAKVKRVVSGRHHSLFLQN